jgi:hypothetical protein
MGKHVFRSQNTEKVMVLHHGKNRRKETSGYELLFNQLGVGDLLTHRNNAHDTFHLLLLPINFWCVFIT